MTRNRSYRLLCPIARALERIGDRWTLLILRDLHAGPARFSELQIGLSGLATNLLSSRLQQLQDDGLISREPNTRAYELTSDGEATAPLLFALASYGTRFAVPNEIRRPGNLRTIVVTLKEGLRRVVDKDSNAHAELVVDDESFAIKIDGGQVNVRYASDPEAPLSIATDYPSLMSVADGDMQFAEFASEHVTIARGSEEMAHSLLYLMARAFAET